MKLEHSFEVEAPLERVWEALIDVERVALCLPGAEITGSIDGAYEGNFTVKLGPTTAAYAGKLEMEEIDEAGHRVRMRATGRDKRGQGGANATIGISLSTVGGATRVEVLTDMALTGRLARFGRGGMIEDVSNRLLRDFVACLQSSIPAAESKTVADIGEGVAPSEPRSSGAESGNADPSGPRSGAESSGAGAATPGAAPPQAAPPQAGPQAAPVRGITLLLSVLLGRIKRAVYRLFGRSG